MQWGFGVLTYKVSLKATIATTSKKHKSYQKWLDNEAFQIGKYAALYGSRAAERSYHSKEKPSLADLLIRI